VLDLITIKESILRKMQNPPISIEKLLDAMLAHIPGMWYALLPREWVANLQQAKMPLRKPNESRGLPLASA
jgi:hypothetical protein